MSGSRRWPGRQIGSRYLQVFVTSFCLFLFETSVFHILEFTHDYLEATLVITYALLGLGIGALVAPLFRGRAGIGFPLLAVLSIASVAAVFVNITRFPRLVSLSPIMVAPFLLGNLLITSLFSAHGANLLYLANLAGSTGGVFASVALIPVLNAEGALLASLAVMAAAGFTFNEAARKVRAFRILLALLAVAAFAGVAANQRWHFLDLERVAKSEVKDYARVWSAGRPNLFTRDSLVARVSVFSAGEGGHGYQAWDGSTSNESWHAYYNGQSNDVIDRAALFEFRNDPRIPFMYHEDGRKHTLFPSAPRVLIIGASAQGIVKSVRFLVGDPSRIDAVEINPAVVGLMRHELYDMSGRAYEGVDVAVTDARAFLRHAGTRYDIITMMNTYTVQVIGYAGEPDFIHTTDAINDYFDHLNDDGFLVLEERGVDERARLAIFRLVGNFKAVIAARGYGDPGRHLFIYRMNDKNGSEDDWYTFIVVKKTPMTEADRSWFARWVASRHSIEYELQQEDSPVWDGSSVFHTELQYLWGTETATDYTAFVEAERSDSLWGPAVRMTPTSDDNPYMFDVYRARPDLHRLLLRVGLACAVLLAATVAVLLRSGSSRGIARSFPLAGYFLLLGLGYLTIEMTLMKLYQSLTGSPANSMIFVLGALLASSGAGGWLSRDFPRRTVALGIAGICGVALFHVFVNRWVLRLVAAPLWLENILVAVSMLPLGFLMGIPFPHGVECAKRLLSERCVAPLIAVNSVASAFGVAFGLYLCVAFGFRLACVAGIGCYAAALTLLLASGPDAGRKSRA